MDHQFYPPLNIEHVFNRQLNDKVMTRFGFGAPTLTTSLATATPNLASSHNHIAKSFSQDLNTLGHHHHHHQQPTVNTFFSNPNLFRSPSAVSIGLQQPTTTTYLKPAPNSYFNFPTQSFTNLNQLNNYHSYETPPVLHHHVVNPAPPPPPAPPSSQQSLIIRKLGQNEKIFHGSLNNNASYIFRAAIVTSEIDLYKNIGLLNTAIEHWKLAHPLLRSRVLTRLHSTAKVEKYFALASDAKLRSMDNVKYLYYNSHSASTCDDLWKLLVEKETTQAMDGEQGLLWRLTFFQIKPHLYALILAFDHCIMDGRSSYYALLELCQIIEELATSRAKRAPKIVNTILPAKEDLFKHRHPPIESFFNHRAYLRAPPFIDQENAYRSTYVKLKYLSRDEEQRGVVYTHDGRPYATVAELVQLSKVRFFTWLYLYV